MRQDTEYVNELPEGYTRETRRCQYRFKHGYSDQGYHMEPGMRCGLPIADDEIGRQEELCYFHSQRRRADDVTLKYRLANAVKNHTYLGEAQLAEAPLQGACLGEVILPHGNLYRAELEHADLSQARLQGAKLSRAQLKGANLHEAQLHGANLQHIFEEDAGDINLRRTVLGEFPDGRAADIGRANLTRALMSGARVMPTVNVSNVTWPRNHCLLDEQYARNWEAWEPSKRMLRGERRPTFQECANIYHELRIACRRSSLQEAESAFFVREMDCHRARMDREVLAGHFHWLLNLIVSRPTILALALFLWLLSALGWWPALPVCAVGYIVLVMLGVYGLLSLICLSPIPWQWPSKLLASIGWWLLYYLAGYAEMPGRVLAWLAGIGGASSVLLWWKGCANGALMNPWDAVYASTMNLTSLNLVGGNYLHPHFTPSGVFNAVASVESVCGIILAALLVACLVRKFAR